MSATPEKGRRSLHPVRTGALVLGAPAVLAALDLLCRLEIASLLELNHDPAARMAALHSATLGVLKDLLLVMPAYGVFALAPRASTLRLTHVVLLLAALILVGDLAYFYFTLEHVEPILFVNLNVHSLRGTLDLRGGLTAALGGVGVLALVWLNSRLLGGARPGLARPTASVFLLGACLLPTLPLMVSTQPKMPHEEHGVAKFLNQTRDAYLKKVSAPILANFFAAAADSRRLEKAAPPIQAARYTPDEAAILRKLRLLDADAPGAQVAAKPSPEIRRIVLLILESLPAAYLHTYNPTVPAEATPFLDSLLRRYPHFDRFHTSNMPSDWGLNSMLLSRLRPDWDGGRPSLLSVLHDQGDFESFYVRGVSKHYSNELQTYTRMFQMNHYIAFEELSERYDSKWHSAWGFNNAVVYEEGVRILREHRDEKVVLVLKTIDLHQPGPFQGIPRKYLPEALQRRDVGLFNALYWVDRCIRGFFGTLEEEGLFDEHTLVVVTSDHTPHPGVEYRQTVPPEEYVRLGRLPLIFATRDPERLRGLDTARIASQVDLSPTLLELVGLPKPRGFVGRSLFGADPNRFAIGVYRDTFYYSSDTETFNETLSEAEPRQTLRNRALRKWLDNLDAEFGTTEREVGRESAHRKRATRRTL
jgi:phosphoglycerol transferase MdoB-like AlkP superfamily enzyme